MKTLALLLFLGLLAVPVMAFQGTGITTSFHGTIVSAADRSGNGVFDQWGLDTNGDGQSDVTLVARQNHEPKFSEDATVGTTVTAAVHLAGNGDHVVEEWTSIGA